MRETKIFNKIMLAPMAGITDSAFRQICEENGCDKTFTEMVSVNALDFNNRATEEIMYTADEEKNCNIQIFGKDCDIIERVIKEKINPREDFKEISFNMGCPAPKIFNNGQGSALMKDVKKVYEIGKCLKESTEKKVNVKIRMGIDEDSINYIEVGKALEDSGIDYVILHGRTRKQQYSGKADWESIRKLKETLSIPVIANGDVFSVKDYKNILDVTGADGVMIARGAMGNPFIFRQIKDYIEGKETSPITYEDILHTIKRQYDLSLKYKSEKLVINQMRKHVGWYIKGLPQAASYRDRVNKLKTSKEIFDLLEEYRKFLEDNYDRK